MAKLLLLSLLGVVLLSVGQGKVLSASDGVNAVLSGEKYSNFDLAESGNEVIDTILDNVEDVVDDMNDADSDDDDLVDDLIGVVDDTAEVVDELIGFPMEDLDEDELNVLLEIEDRIFVGEVDVHIAKSLLLENRSVTSQAHLTPHGRRKRIAPLIGRAAFLIGRSLFRKFARTGSTPSGARITRHYQAPGNYQSAVRDFQRLRPTGVKPFRSGRISGETGMVGNYRVTVRDGSTKGAVSRPTLSVSSHGGSLLRKFRYDKVQSN